MCFKLPHRFISIHMLMQMLVVVSHLHLPETLFMYMHARIIEMRTLNLQHMNHSFKFSLHSLFLLVTQISIEILTAPSFVC